MAHLLMVHLRKSHGQAPTSGRMSTGQTGKDEMGMDNCEQMTWSSSYEVDIIVTLFIEKEIEAQRDWILCPKSYSSLMAEPRFDPRVSDFMVLNHLPDFSSGSSHFCGNTCIILPTFLVDFNENYFSRRLKCGNNNALWNDVMDFFKK